MMSVQWCVFGVLQRIVSDLATYNDGKGIELDLLDSYYPHTQTAWEERDVAWVRG